MGVNLLFTLAIILYSTNTKKINRKRTLVPCWLFILSKEASAVRYDTLLARDKNKANDRHEIVIVILTNRTFMEYHEYEIKMIDEIGINKVKIYEN